MNSIIKLLATTALLLSFSAANAEAINPGNTLLKVSTCEAERGTIKIYVGENFLQSKSTVLINYAGQIEGEDFDALAAHEGEVVLNEFSGQMEYNIIADDEIISTLRLDIETTSLSGKLSIPGWAAECK